MQAERTPYWVAGWGEGELWTGAGLVLAHDFHFSAEAYARSALDYVPPAPDYVRPAPHEGGGSPPSGTVAGGGARVGDGSVTTLRRPSRHDLDPDPFVEDLVARLSAFLAGEAVALEDVPLELGSSSPFQRAVADALRAIPRGEVVTYGELAALAGHPGAQRAVGTVCARNRFMFLLPCHRVVAADGIGGYGSAGVAVKRRLLALEGVEL